MQRRVRLEDDTGVQLSPLSSPFSPPSLTPNTSVKHHFYSHHACLCHARFSRNFLGLAPPSRGVFTHVQIAAGTSPVSSQVMS